MDEIEREQWNSFIVPSDSPFIEYDWLHTLEQTGCASTRMGWQPLHIGVFNKKNDLVALSPMYVKYHSYGEFIFDQSWAGFAQQQLGIDYYPKLLTAIPFTPSTGSRMIFSPSLSGTKEKDDIMMAVAKAIRSLTRNNKLSSAHVNFMQPEDVPPYEQQGFLHRETIQYRWKNRDKDTGELHRNFVDYLSTFKSKRRISIKRERSKVMESGVEIRVIKGLCIDFVLCT